MQLKLCFKLQPDGGRNSKSTIWIFVILAVLFICPTSCIKDVDLQLEEIENRLVLKCLFTENQFMKVMLGHSIPIGDEKFYPVSDASVILYQDLQPYDTLTEERPGMYFTNVVPEKGKKYHVTCNAPGFQTILSNNSEIPETCNIISAVLIDSVSVDESDIVSELKILFSDTPGQNNYYDLDITYVNNYVSTDLETYKANYIDLGKDPALINEGLLKYYPSSLIFSDALFDGNNYNLTVNLIYKEYDVMVILRSIPPQLYNYLRTLTLYSNSVDYSLWGSAEPVNVVSNINNGFGIFSGYSADTLYIPRNENR